jgi:phage/plasmid-like protein (TIGR03299 family)
MTEERIADLQRDTLVGFTDKRGNAWHYDSLSEDSRRNAFREEVPVERAVELVDFPIKKRPLMFRGDTKSNVQIPGQFAWVRWDGGRGDSGASVLGITGKRFVDHPYRTWLIDLASQIVGPEAQIGSCGLLKGGARAWVSIELPENRMAAGMEWRPMLLASAVYDRSSRTIFKLVQTRVVCDNTREAALSENGSAIYVRHTSGGLLVAGQAQEMLGLLVDAGRDPFQLEAELLLSTAVSDAAYAKFCEALVGERGEDVSAFARGIRGRRYDALQALWQTDERVAPWRGTAFGAVQASNTWQHWGRIIKGEASKPQRNMADVIGGQMLASDRDAMRLLVKAGVRMPAQLGLDAPSRRELRQAASKGSGAVMAMAGSSRQG